MLYYSFFKSLKSKYCKHFIEKNIEFLLISEKSLFLSCKVSFTCSLELRDHLILTTD